MIGKKIITENCEIEHLGNAGARAHQTANGGDPAAVWVSTVAWGMGTWSAADIQHYATIFRSGFQAYLAHNATTAQDRGSKVALQDCLLVCTGLETSDPVTAWFQSFGSGQRDLAYLRGTTFTGGDVRSTIQSGSNQEWRIAGSGNAGLSFRSGDPVDQMVTE